MKKSFDGHPRYVGSAYFRSNTFEKDSAERSPLQHCGCFGMVSCVEEVERVLQGLEPWKAFTRR